MYGQMRNILCICVEGSNVKPNPKMEMREKGKKRAGFWWNLKLFSMPVVHNSISRKQLTYSYAHAIC